MRKLKAVFDCTHTHWILQHIPKKNIVLFLFDSLVETHPTESFHPWNSSQLFKLFCFDLQMIYLCEKISFMETKWLMLNGKVKFDKRVCLRSRTGSDTKVYSTTGPTCSTNGGNNKLSESRLYFCGSVSGFYMAQKLHTLIKTTYKMRDIIERLK